jgi:hypothetical protein
VKYVQYLGPSDTIDMSNVLGKQDMVFHTPTNEAVDADQRGNVLHVTNEAFEELQTYPRHFFVEVEEGPAKELIAKQSAARTVREQRQALYDAHTAQAAAAPSIQEQIAAVPASAEIAASRPASASQIRAETRAARNTTATPATGTTANTPNVPSASGAPVSATVAAPATPTTTTPATATVAATKE